jgi:hypothetical protein
VIEQDTRAEVAYVAWLAKVRLSSDLGAVYRSAFTGGYDAGVAAERQRQEAPAAEESENLDALVRVLNTLGEDGQQDVSSLGLTVTQWQTVERLGHKINRISAYAVEQRGRAETAEAARAGLVDLRPEVLAFAQLMEAKLRENDHKGGWQYDSPWVLSGRIFDEAREVREALQKPSVDPMHVACEAADVANFAMMVADRVGALAATAGTPSAPPDPSVEPTRLCQECDGTGEAEGLEPGDCWACHGSGAVSSAPPEGGE